MLGIVAISFNIISCGNKEDGAQTKDSLGKATDPNVANQKAAPEPGLNVPATSDAGKETGPIKPGEEKEPPPPTESH